jgi:hypothetical protein
LNDASVTARGGGVAAIAGAVTLFVGTALHPMSADPNDLVAAFAEYAADRVWIFSHLTQFIGVALLGAALVSLASSLKAERDEAAAWARVGGFGAAVSVAVAAALQAVDGVALKIMVDRWATSSGQGRALAFEAAFAVRQIEIGLASLLSVTFGLTATVFGVALLSSARVKRWLGVVALVGGLGTTAAGVVQAYSGFSSTAMLLSMTSSSVLLVWAVCIGVALLRVVPASASQRG